MANVILFGPPGVGKSTLIGILKTRGISAIDLEDLYPNRIRFQIPNLVKDAFIGAADLDPKRHYPGSVKVLLYADQKQYELRRAKRDAEVEGKSNQAAHSMEDWNTPNTFDHVLDTTHLGVQATANALTSIFKEAQKHE